jgi:circadian clock protein KaiC
MVDTWISLEDLELNGERSKRMYLMKSRGMSHSKKEMELILSDAGVSLLSIDRPYNESVIGSRKMAQEIQQSNAVFQSQPTLSQDGHQK